VDSRLWWALPGSLAFIESILESVRKSSCLVVRLPEIWPGGLEQALTSFLVEDDMIDPRTIDCSQEDGRMPAEILCDNLLLPENQPTFPEAVVLSESGEFDGMLIILREIPSDKWGQWTRFIKRFLHHQKTQLLSTNTNFAIIAPMFVSDIPQEFSVIDWRGIIGRDDMMIYVAHRFRHWPPSPLVPRLYQAVVTELAGYDPFLAELFLAQKPEKILFPLDLIYELARNHKLQGKEKSYAVGTMDDWEGREYVHSCVIVEKENTEELSRRVWKAHVSVLFPWLEEIRIRIIEQYREHLRPERRSEYSDIVREISDLEISQIRRQLRHVDSVPEDMITFLRFCKDIRNKIGHREPVNGELILKCDEYYTDGFLRLIS
jgi:hypothetical protein